MPIIFWRAKENPHEEGLKIWGGIGIFLNALFATTASSSVHPLRLILFHM